MQTYILLKHKDQIFKEKSKFYILTSFMLPILNVFITLVY